MAGRLVYNRVTAVVLPKQREDGGNSPLVGGVSISVLSRLGGVMMQPGKRALASRLGVASASLLPTAPAAAQMRSNPAGLQRVVTDPQGERLPGRTRSTRPPASAVVGSTMRPGLIKAPQLIWLVNPRALNRLAAHTKLTLSSHPVHCRAGKAWSKVRAMCEPEKSRRSRGEANHELGRRV